MKIRATDIGRAGGWAEAAPLLERILRDIRLVLNGGWRVRDQALVRDVVIDTGQLPLVVDLPPNVHAIGVELVSARLQGATDGRVLSGGSISWDAQGGLRLHSLSALAATTRYDAVIAVME